jgi:type I restriction enzyme S subunit
MGKAAEAREARPGYGAKEEHVPPGYKQTEVGVIPEEWDSVPIVELARLESGHTPSRRMPSYWAGDVPWVSLHDTDQLDSHEILRTRYTVSDEGLAHSSARLLPKGTVVFSRTATVGKSTILGRDMATSQDFANYICGPKLHNRFLVYLLRSMGREWERMRAGSTHNTVYMPVFERLRIPLPPLPEQRAIARALSDVDDLISALDKLIEKKRAIKQATMQQLLTGRTRLPGFGGEWGSTILGRVGEFYKGQGISRRDVVAEGVPCIRYGELYTHYRNWTADTVSRTTHKAAQKSVAVRTGDLLFAASGETAEEIGACVAYLGNEVAYAGGDIIVLRPNGDDSCYLGYLLDHESITTQKARVAQGDAVVHISARNLSRIELHLPPLPEQRAIATVLSDMDAEIAALERRREKTRLLKQGMMQELLTGRIRLVETADREVAAG